MSIERLLSSERRCRARVEFLSFEDQTARKIIRRDSDGHFVPQNDPNAVTSHPSRKLGTYDVPIGELDRKMPSAVNVNYRPREPR